MSPMKHILTGFKVLDFSHVLAGPSATRIMAEMGADVIKVETPTLGDLSRLLPVFKNGRSAYYLQQNRGKRSICVNLKEEEGKAIIRELLKQVDVVMENFAPGVIGRLGFGWEQVHALNPRAVMCSISAFGQQGPLANLPGYDYIAQAYSGVTSMIGEPDGAPSLPMLGIGDVMTGVHAACAIGYALLHRERGGLGQYLDISLLDSYFHCHEINVQVYSASGGQTVPTRCGHHHFAVTPLGLFKAREHYICIIALDQQWPGVCRAIGRPELAADERYDKNLKRVERSAEVNAMIQAWMDSMPSDDAILKALEAERIPVAPVRTIAEAVNEPHLRDRGTVRAITDPKFGSLEVPGMPLRFSGFPNNIPLDAAYLGEHNAEILSSVLGYSAERIDTLAQNGVLYANPET
ncbi:MAG: CoA transferase [Gammaproteobacteria bacterium]|nr:CoA transferase [Gammaproteobacteria bacterium]MBI5615057.1 CoA transferase [Gammaproteobacteria bacterium]